MAVPIPVIVLYSYTETLYLKVYIFNCFCFHTTQEDAKKFISLAKQLNSEKICLQVTQTWKLNFKYFPKYSTMGKLLNVHVILSNFPKPVFVICLSFPFLIFFLLLKNNIGGWSWWATSDTTGLQCKRWSLSNAGGYWRNYSSGSYEGKHQPSVPFPPLGQVHSFHHFLSLCWPFYSRLFQYI